MLDRNTLFKYVDYFLTNCRLGEDIEFTNEYDRCSDFLKRDDPLREYKHNLRIFLLDSDFIYEEDSMIFLTQKDIEANSYGGYFKWLKHKNKPLKYQKIALIISSIAILVSIISPIVVTNKITKVNRQFDSLSVESRSLKSDIDSLNRKLYLLEKYNPNIFYNSLPTSDSLKQ